MSDPVTTAELLSRVFSQLHRAINGTGVPLFQGWKSVIGGPGMTDLETLENLGLISSSLTRLRAQITESERLSESTKRSAMQTVAAFSPLLQLGNLHQGGAHYATLCAEKPCGDLSMIGHGLEREFSESRLHKADADEIAESLREVQKLLAGSELPLDLRVNLEKHLKAMLWWLEHPEIASAQDLFESMGSAMILAGQLVERPGAGSEDTKRKATSIKALIGDAAQRLAKIVGYAIEHADKIEKLVHVADEVNKQLPR